MRQENSSEAFDTAQNGIDIPFTFKVTHQLFCCKLVRIGMFFIQHDGQFAVKYKSRAACNYFLGIRNDVQPKICKIIAK